MKISELGYTEVLTEFNEKHIRVISPNVIESHEGRKYDIPNEDSPFACTDNDPGHVGSILYCEVHVVGNTYAVSVTIGGSNQVFIAHGAVHKEHGVSSGDIAKLADLIRPKETRIQPLNKPDLEIESFDSMSRFKRDALYSALVFQGLIPDKIEEVGFDFVYIYNVALECWIGLAFKEMPEDQGKSILSTVSTSEFLQSTLSAYEAHDVICFTGDDMINVIEMTVLKAYLSIEDKA